MGQRNGAPSVQAGSLPLVASSLIMFSGEPPSLPPQPLIFVALEGAVREAQGRASIRSLGSGTFEISVELREDAPKEWSLSIREGTCANPGQLRYRPGAIENETVRSQLDGDIATLADLIVVVSPLGDDAMASCGTIRF